MNTGRTSISRLRKSPRSYFQPKEKLVNPRDACPKDVSAEQPDNKPIEATIMEQNIQDQAERLKKVGKPTTMSILTAHNEANRPQIVSLKMPYWGNSHDRGLLRRSKRSHQASAKTSQTSRMPKLPPKRSELMDDDDVSPTSSAGPATLQLIGLPSNSNSRSLVPDNPSPTSDVSALEERLEALEAKALEARQADFHSNDVSKKGKSATEPPTPGFVLKDRSDDPGEKPGDESSQQDTIATSCLSPQKSTTRDNRGPLSSKAPKGTNSRQLDCDNTGDQEALVTCLIFSSPFRRNSSAVTPPVRERISIFEGLGKSTRYSPPIQYKTQRERSRNYSSISDTSRPSSRRKSFAWIPKTLRKMSVHRRKDRKLSHASTDEGTRSTSETSEEGQANLRKLKNNNNLLAHLSDEKTELDTASFAASSSQLEPRP